MPRRAAINMSSFGNEPQGVCCHAMNHSISKSGRWHAAASAHVSDWMMRSQSSSNLKPPALVVAG
jgi:hypothetical protein